jgi:hypothetical protein
MARVSSTDTVHQSTPALAELLGSIALAGAFLSNLRLAARKSAIKVRGGRARARTATRDERGRFVAKLGEPVADNE